MESWALSLLAGGALLLFFTHLPSFMILLSIAVILALLTILLYRKTNKIHLIWLFFFGFSWTWFAAWEQSSWILPDYLQSKNLIATGTITSIPEIKEHAISFEFLTQSLQLRNSARKSIGHRCFSRGAGGGFADRLAQGCASRSQDASSSANPPPAPLEKHKEPTLNESTLHNYHGSHLIKLSWRKPPRPLKVGDQWQFEIRLKRPRGFWSPGSFDYQAWLFTRGIRATGYVTNHNENVHWLETSRTQYPIEYLRESLSHAITTTLTDMPMRGLVTALAVGIRTDIMDSQWNTMRWTGTNHLFAIAGLHIGFVTGMLHLITSFIWRRLGRLPLYLATPHAAVIVALTGAILYSLLAGFALPTKRAIMMISVFLLACLGYRKLAPWNAWSLALLLVFLFDPLTILSDTFWLSFGAVALIIYSNFGRIKRHNLWHHWGYLQGVIAVGLIPLSLLFFHQTSFAGFFANAIAIPWVGFVTLPLSLFGNIAWFFNHQFAGWLWYLAEYSLEIIWPILNYVAKLNWAQWTLYLNNKWLLFTSLVAVALMLAPKGLPGRWLAVFWGLPLILWMPQKPQWGEIWFSLLDVGQGLSTVVRTADHTLIYDAGPSFGRNFSTGSAVVVPFLQTNRINYIDMMIISHGDNDHIGGAKHIIEQLPVRQIMTSVPEKFLMQHASICHTGQRWHWDGIDFTVLHPDNLQSKNRNDRSCVLSISNQKHQILLTGDIERGSEKQLLQKNILLKSDILVAPHHGSKTSSTPDFIAGVHPTYVLFPVGYHNRFHFPRPQIVENYLQIGAKLYSTAELGTTTFKLSNDIHDFEIETYHLHFWDF